MRTILIFAYYSYKDPVFQSAVLPYLKEIQDENINYILLTWEKKEYNLSDIEISDISKELKEYNIIWKRNHWHSGSLKILKKIYDFLFGIIYTLFLIRKYHINKIFSEGFPGAIIGHFISKLSNKPHIIHTFEPHAEYMLESNVWTKSSWEYKLLKRLEIPIGRHAQSIITATAAYKKVLSKKINETNIHVIPSCINMDDYYYDEKEREQIRHQLGIEDDQIVIVYLGKIGGMYMDEDLFRFFDHCKRVLSSKVYFFLFTNHPVEEISKKLTNVNLTKNDIYIRYLSKTEVFKYLSAADIGFCGVRPIPHQRYSSPIKNGEYWACGLPVLIPEGISDDHLLVEEYTIGKSFRTITEITKIDLEYLNSISKTKIRSAGFQLRSLEKYHDSWLKIFLK